MKRKFALLLSLVVFIGLFAGCTSAPENETKPADSTDPSVRMLVDELGREVEIPEDPQKVLGLTSAVMEALFNVGTTPVGKVEEYKIREEGMALPSVGVTNTLNMEKIYELEPDFIIASSRFHAGQEEELELAGCPIYFFDPDAVGEVSIVDLTPFIGDLLGKAEAGQDYREAIMAQSDDLKSQISAIGGYDTGMIIKTGDTITCAQRSSGYGALLILLGIENIVPDDLPNAKKSPYVAYDVEQIIKDNPDVIFVIAPGKEAEANKAILADIKADEKWAELDAIKNGKIFMLPFSVNPNRMNVEDMLTATTGLIIDQK